MTKCRRALVLAIALACVLAVAGCSTVEPAGPQTPVPAEATATPAGKGDTGISIKGSISDVQAAEPGAEGGNRLGSIRIEGGKVEGNQYDRAQVTVTKETRIQEKKGDSLVPVTFEALEFGELVTARFVGPVMESYPVQATAGEIVILARMPRQ